MPSQSVPGVDVQLQIAIGPATSDVGEAECARSITAELVAGGGELALHVKIPLQGTALRPAEFHNGSRPVPEAAHLDGTLVHRRALAAAGDEKPVGDRGIDHADLHDAAQQEGHGYAPA